MDILGRIPAALHPSTNLVLKNAAIIAIDTLVRMEPSYILVRGREGGSTDEGRTFFVTYDEIAYIKIERILKVNDLKRLYGERITEADTDTTPDMESLGKETATIPSDTVTPAPLPAAPMDPAAIAKQNLLDRIRNARTSTLSGIRTPR